MKYFSLLIKPSSHGCNLRCDYCFYLQKKKFYPKAIPRMSIEVLERMVQSFQALDLLRYDYAWQGGEPTIMGLDFFKKVVEFQLKYSQPGQQIFNSIQTNGTLIDDTWANFLAKYKFLVGLSCDGPADIHNATRRTVRGEGSHKIVMCGRDALIRHNVDYNILTVVNSSNINKPIEVYKYIRDDLGQNFHQYIECVEFDQNGKLMPYGISGRQFGEFMCAIFDEWYENDSWTISVRLFDTILLKLVDNATSSCSFASDCRQYLVVEHNGDIFPCDFFVEPDRWQLGNIMNNNWSDLVDSPLYAEFGTRKSLVNDACKKCDYLDICQGCCPKNRWGQGDEPTRISVLCEGWKIFYSHTLPRFKELAREVKKRREQERAAPFNHQFRPLTAANIKRNDPCPCGSGSKYKQCCGK